MSSLTDAQARPGAAWPHPLVSGPVSGLLLWLAFPPVDWGWLAWVADEDKLYVWSGAAWAEFVSGAGSLHHVVEDTAPQLGGDLDANGHNLGFDSSTGITDDSGNEQVVFHKTASAVNQVGITNAATGNAPQVAAEGGDTNIDLKLRGYFLIDATDLDAAIGIAKRIPGARFGTVEIRPVVELAGLPS